MTGAALAGWLAAAASPALLLAAILAASFVLEDAAVVAAALLAARGLVDPGAALAILCFGTTAGDFGLHFAGRWARRHRWVERRCSAAGFERASDRVHRRPWRALILARFVPGLRLPTYLASGLMRVPLGSFSAAVIPANLVWTLALFLAGAAGWATIPKTSSLAAAIVGIAMAALSVSVSKPRRARQYPA